MTRRLVAALLFALALALLSLNVAGLFSSSRHPDLRNQPVTDGYRYKKWPAAFGEVVTLGPAGLRAAARRRPGEGDGRFAARLTEAVYRGMAHYWADEHAVAYRLRVPATENYLLFAASFIWPDQFGKYEYYDPDRAIARGVGACSQLATVLAHLLARERIDSHIALFDRHTVVVARLSDVAGGWWVLDPDYGVVIPLGLKEIRRDPAQVLPYYVQQGFAPEQVRAEVIPVYSDPRYREVNGAAGYHRFRRLYEPASYLLIWLLPIALAAAGVAVLRLRVRRDRAAARALLPEP